MKPSWSDAPELANWLAMDDGGQWWWYESRPYYDGDHWLVDPLADSAKEWDFGMPCGDRFWHGDVEPEDSLECRT